MNIDASKKTFLRDVIGAYMTTLGARDASVAVVNADLSGTCRNRSFVERYPERSYNMGIAEQDMVSFAAGLAHEGCHAYAFSMAPFLTMRACEQVRTDVAYGDLPVTLVGAYAGVSGGISGATHWSIEDVAIMCGIPGITVLEPCDAVQAERMMDWTLTQQHPVYLRTSVEPMIGIYDDTDDAFTMGKANTVVGGDDGAFLCAGVTVKYAIAAARAIREKTGKRIRVVDMHTIKPLDRAAVRAAAATGAIVAAQDHNIYGGLGTQVAQVLAEEGIGVRFQNVGIPDRFTAMAHAPYLYHAFGYDAEGLETHMMNLLHVHSGGGRRLSVKEPFARSSRAEDRRAASPLPTLYRFTLERGIHEDGTLVGVRGKCAEGRRAA